MMILRSARSIFVLLVFGIMAFAGVNYYSGNSSAYAQEVSLSAQELFFYDEKGRKHPLVFLPKLAVRYVNFENVAGGENTTTPEAVIMNRFRERSSLVPLSVVKVPELGVWAYTVSFLPSTSFSDLMAALVAVREPNRVEITPIFRIEQREAAIDGIVIDTNAELSSSRVRAFLKGVLGNVAIRYVDVVENRAIVKFEEFFFSSTKVPLDVLTLANLLTKSGDAKLWLTRARPNFVFLDQPVSVLVSVSPVTGTVGEPRTLTLTVHVRGKDVMVNEDILPVFGEGKFVPMAEGSFPGSSFFKVDENNVKKLRFSDDLGLVIKRVWTFSLFAAETEWVIKPVTVLFKQGDENKEAKTQDHTFVSLLHTKQGLEIKDMPPPELLPEALSFLSRIMIMGEGAEIASVDLPRYWFDRFLGADENTVFASIARVVGIILGSLGVCLAVWLIAHGRSRSRRHPEERRAMIQKLSLIKEKYRKGQHSQNLTEQTEKILSDLENDINITFRIVFPGIPGKHFSLKLIEEYASGDTLLYSFMQDNKELLREIFQTVNKKYAAECSLNKDEYELLMAKSACLFDNLSQHFNESGG